MVEISINSILNHSVRLEVVLLCFVTFSVIMITLFWSCFGDKFTSEGFQILGAPVNYLMGEGVKGSWDTPIDTKDVTPPYSHLESNTTDATTESSMYMFSGNKMSLDCCPSSYSNSMGCACITPEQMQFLNQRGGNRTLTTEF